MARPKKAEEHKKGAPLWMATFSDLVTLLLTFFVLLMGMANFEDAAKVDAVLLSIREALGGEGVKKKLLELHQAETGQTPIETPDPDILKPLEARLREAMSEHISDDMMRMVNNEQEVRIRLDERVFFKPGSAVLHPSAYAVIADVGKVLKATEMDVRVEGYADGLGEIEANWSLSSERALAVVHALRERGSLEGSRLEATAFGPHHPGRSVGEDNGWNRRIELVLRADKNRGVGKALTILEEGKSDGG
jgi:chemotaxis protein MotB